SKVSGTPTPVTAAWPPATLKSRSFSRTSARSSPKVSSSSRVAAHTRKLMRGIPCKGSADRNSHKSTQRTQKETRPSLCVLCVPLRPFLLLSRPSLVAPCDFLLQPFRVLRVPLRGKGMQAAGAGGGEGARGRGARRKAAKQAVGEKRRGRVPRPDGVQGRFDG